MQIGWFSTGRDEEAKRLLEETLRAIEGGLKIHIAFVFCNREYGESPVTDDFLNFAQAKGIKTITFSSRYFKPELRKASLEIWREEYHRHVWDLISKYNVEFSFLAGYMLIVGKTLIEAHRMLNLHPAVPGGPKGSWQDVIWELIRTEADYAGAQIHLVTPELDEGPAITFCKFSIKTPEFEPLWKVLREDLKERSLEELRKANPQDYPLFKKIRQEEFKREIPLILLTLKKISLEGLRLIKGGFDLSDDVNDYLRATQAR